MYPRVHVIGDSHALHTAGLFHVHHICNEETLQGATAHNLLADCSITRSKEKIAAILDALDPPRDIILLVFGEVDCRFHLRDEAGVSATITRYAQFIESVRERGYRVIVQGVIGAVPQDNSWRQADYPDILSRGAVVVSFNDTLRAWCDNAGVEFFDTRTSGTGGALPAHLTDDGVHLNDKHAKVVYEQFTDEFDVGPSVNNAVWCVQGMEHFGFLLSRVLGWPLYVGTSVGTVDTVIVVGLYDPPTYHTTLECTHRARRRVIYLCGSDIQMLSPQMLPADATYLVETDGMARELWDLAGIEARVIPFPTTHHLKATPLPERPAIAFYTGTNPAKYGSGIMEAIDAAFPDIDIYPYAYGQYDARGLQRLVDSTTVAVRLPEHDGAAATAREFLEAGRQVVCTADLPHAKRVSRLDVPAIFKAIRHALKATAPNAEAIAHYSLLNSEARFLTEIGEVL